MCNLPGLKGFSVVRSRRSIVLRGFALALVLLVAAGGAVPALAAGGGGKGSGKGPASLFIPVDRLSMPLKRFDDRQVGLLDLDISIEAPDEAAVGRIRAQMPRIRDRLLTHFNPPASEEASVSAEALTDMKTRILTLLHDLLGVDGVKAIYITRALAVPV